VTPAGSVPCKEIAACLVGAASAAASDPAAAAARIEDCLSTIPNTSAVSAMVGMPGIGTLGVAAGTQVSSFSVACQSPAVDARLAEGGAKGDPALAEKALTLYGEARAADDPAEQKQKVEAANLLIGAFEQSVVADTTDMEGGSTDSGSNMTGGEFEWSDDNWAQDAADAAAEVGDLIERGANSADATQANNAANAAIGSTLGTMVRAFMGLQRTADVDDPCEDVAQQFAECNAKEWRTDQCQQLRNSFLNPRCDATAALTAEGTPCAPAGTPDPKAMLAATVAACQKLVRGSDGTDPCQPPPFNGWQAGKTPGACADPAALTRDDQCLPGWFPPEDLDRVARAQQIAVLAKITKKYGGRSVVVVPPSGPVPGFGPGPK
jgi:hypothetical protein